MSTSFRALTLTLALSALIPLARADDSRAERQRTVLEDGRRAVGVMRDSYAYVVRKEQVAKDARDPVRLNRLHEISNRIAQLVTIASRTLEDLRLAVASEEGMDVVNAESEKLILIREKVDQARREADEEGMQERKVEPTKTDVSSTFDSDSWNLVDGTIQYTPTNPGPAPCTIPSTRPGPHASTSSFEGTEGTTGATSSGSSPCS